MTKEQEMARVDLVELDHLYYDLGEITEQEYLQGIKDIEREYKVEL